MIVDFVATGFEEVLFSLLSYLAVSDYSHRSAWNLSYDYGGQVTLW
jgi:hypothetical protein